MFQYYDYLGWGVGIVPKGDDFLKEASHVETEELYGLDLIQESIDVDFGEDEQEARDDYNLLFLSPHISGERLQKLSIVFFLLGGVSIIVKSVLLHT